MLGLQQVCIVIAVIVTATSSFAQSSSPAVIKKIQPSIDDPAKLFRRAKNEFTHGDYQSAIEHLTSLIYPIKLGSEDELLEARRILGISYYLTGKKDSAEEEFSKLLYMRPSYQLDPFFVSPPIIELFEKIRVRLKPQLDALLTVRQEREAKRKKERLTKTKQQPVVIKKEKITYYYRNPIVCWLPFGVGQYQNEDNRLGHFFMASQGVAILANITSGILHYYFERKRTNGAQYSNTLKALEITNYVSLGLFASLWFSSSLEAWLSFEPVSKQIDYLPAE